MSVRNSRYFVIRPQVLSLCHFLFFLFASGAVVASRLSEIEDWNVLLLEAGGDETEISDVPMFAGYLQLSQLDWKYKTEPQGDVCLGI